MKIITRVDLVLRLRMRGSVSHLSPYAFIAWCLIKHWENCKKILKKNHLSNHVPMNTYEGDV